MDRGLHGLTAQELKAANQAKLQWHLLEIFLQDSAVHFFTSLNLWQADQLQRLQLQQVCSKGRYLTNKVQAQSSIFDMHILAICHLAQLCVFW